MDLYEAKRVMEVSGELNKDELKKNYKRLAMKYHPDKSTDPSAQTKFQKINEAYNLLNDYVDRPPQSQFTTFTFMPMMNEHLGIFQELFSQFNKVNTKFTEKVNKETYETKVKYSEISLNMKEYISGTTKEATRFVRRECDCELILCQDCGGGGILPPAFDFCQNCIGCGWYKNCKRCKRGILKEKVPVKVVIPSCVDLNNTLEGHKLTLEDPDPNYFYAGGKIVYRLNITLQQSLIGFTTEFTDPLGNIHKIDIKNTIITSGNGYIVKMSDLKIYILFNVVIPQSLPPDILSAIGGLPSF